MDVLLVADDALFGAHRDADVAIDTAGGFDDVGALARRKEVDSFGWAGLATEAAIDARLEEDSYRHLLARTAERRRAALNLFGEEFANFG